MLRNSSHKKLTVNQSIRSLLDSSQIIDDFISDIGSYALEPSVLSQPVHADSCHGSRVITKGNQIINECAQKRRQKYAIHSILESSNVVDDFDSSFGG